MPRSKISGNQNEGQVEETGKKAEKAENGKGAEGDKTASTLDKQISDKQALIQALKSVEVIKAFEEILIPSLNKYIVDSVEKCVAPVKDQLTATQLDIEYKHESVIQKIDKVQKKQAEVEQKVSDIERRSKQNNLLLHGVPLQTVEGGTREESFIFSIMQIFNEAGITGIESKDFEAVLKITPAGLPPFLLVCMRSVFLKRKVFSQRTKLRNCKEKVFMNEDLTKREAALHKKARSQVKEGSLHSCWTAEGLVYAKASPEGTPFQIKDL